MNEEAGGTVQKQGRFSRYGFRVLKYLDLDDMWISVSLRKEKSVDFNKDFSNIQWNGILAQKKT